MIRAAATVLILYFCYLDFVDDLSDWLPAWGAIYGGQIIWQTVILGVLALIVFGTVVGLGYRFLDWIFE
jgi:hypothetical protein